MPYETETTTMTASGWEEDWANWWQGYWSDASEVPAASTPEPVGRAWRESAREFDFGGE